MQHYLLIPNSLEFKRLREAAISLNNKRYRENAIKEHQKYILIPETACIKSALESQLLQSQVKFVILLNYSIVIVAF